MLRRVGRLLAAAAAGLGIVLALGAGSAPAATCSVAAGVVTVTIHDETATLSVGSASHIDVNGAWCSPATTGSTDLINVVGAGANDTLVIDESGGPFAPGATAESAGVNEIELLLGRAQTHADRVEHLMVEGSPAPDRITIGEGLNYPSSLPEGGVGAPVGAPPVDNAVPDGSVGMVNLNGDGDADVFVAVGSGEGPEDIASFSIEVHGNAGSDEIAGLGGAGTGPPALSDLVLDGGPGDDTLTGGNGDDVFSTGPGSDVVDGGASSEDKPAGAFCNAALDAQGEPSIPTSSGDWITYAASPGPVAVDLDPEQQPIGVVAKPDGSDTLRHVENVAGSPAGDLLSGDDRDNVILGGGGDDTIAGDAGNDCEPGQAGDDTFDENEGTTTAQGGTGTSNGADLLLGGEGGGDTVDYSGRTTPVDVFLEPPAQGFFALAEADTGAVRLCGQPSTGLLSGPQPPAGVVTVGMDGADVNGNAEASDPVDERDCVFSDTERALGGAGGDTLDAGFAANRADNELAGNGGNDLEAGGPGNDRFDEGSEANGADVLDGGGGSDWCDYAGRTAGVSVSLADADGDGSAGEGDRCGGVVPPSLAVGLTVTVTVFNVCRGSGGVLCRAARPAPSRAGRPASRLPMGCRAVLTACVQLTAQLGPIPGAGPASTPSNVENVNGGDGNDVLSGSDQGNVLNGNAGNDTLSGDGGADQLNGGDGNDRLAGGAGNDALDGGGGTDWVDESDASSGVNINLTSGQLSGDGSDTLTGIENASGSPFADVLRGDAGNNVLNGNAGNDVVQGLGGNDIVNGGAGNDELGGGAGNDVVTGGRGNDSLSGGPGADRLSGGPGADTLLGGAGNDVLSGGAGKDVLRGGRGTDRCNVGAPGLGHGESVGGCES